jgi:hypothetical protein
MLPFGKMGGVGFGTFADTTGVVVTNMLQITRR